MEDEKRSTQMSLIHSSWWRKQIFNFCITFQSFYFQWMQHEDNLVLVFLSVAKFFKGRSGWLVRSIVFFLFLIVWTFQCGFSPPPKPTIFWVKSIHVFFFFFVVSLAFQFNSSRFFFFFYDETWNCYPKKSLKFVFQVLQQIIYF